MITGVETAGLVLAAFPIVVESLSKYVEGVETIRYWRRFRKELARYARKLENQRVWYLDTLEELLDGIVQTNEELAPFINDPTGPGWKLAEYEERLRLRLGHAYEHYFDTLVHMLKMLKDMRNKLGVDDNGQVSWHDLGTLDRKMHRLKISLSRGIYNEALNEIDKANKDLREFTHQSLHLEPSRRKRQSKRLMAQFKMIRRQAASLYNVIINGTSWICSCKNSHLASLRLKPRPRRLDDLTLSPATDVRFHILLSTIVTEGRSNFCSDWREIVVKSKENDDPPGLPEDRKVDTPSCPRSEPQKKRIRFTSPVRHHLPIPQTTNLTHSKSTTTLAITNICASVHQDEISDREIGFLTDERMNKRRHHLCIANEGKQSQSIHTKTLDLLLEESSNGGHGPNLTRHDRLYVAVTLASSVLQLEQTSWLKKHWSSSDISFHYPDGSNRKKNRPALAYPYLSWKPSLPDSSGHNNADSSVLGMHLVRNESLFALGLALIELCFGMTLSKLEKPQDKASNEAVTRLNTARRLLDSVYDEIGYRYGDVVRRCLFCPFDVREASLDNDEFQEAVFSNIVTPLFQDLEAFGGSTLLK